MSNFKYQSRERQREKEAYRQIDTEQILWKCSSFRFSTETDHDNCSYSWDNVRHLHLRDRNAATCKYTHSQPLASTSTRIHTDELVYTTHIHSIQHTHTHTYGKNDHLEIQDIKGILKAMKDRRVIDDIVWTDIETRYANETFIHTNTFSTAGHSSLSQKINWLFFNKHQSTHMCPYNNSRTQLTSLHNLLNCFTTKMQSLTCLDQKRMHFVTRSL